MTIYKCDRCGKTESENEHGNRPKDWKCLGYNISNCGRKDVYKDICPDCCKVLKFPENIHCPEVGDRIIEIIEEVIQDVVSDIG